MIGLVAASLVDDLRVVLLKNGIEDQILSIQRPILFSGQTDAQIYCRQGKA